MRKLIHPVRRALNQAQSRFVRSRAGSVLILVVALLVLMALIGTAFMSMAQSDRGSASLHTNNTEVDLLLDGVVSLVKGTVTTDLFGAGQYRQGAAYNYYVSTPPPAPTTYNHLTGTAVDPPTASVGMPGEIPPNAGDRWIASRLPELLNDDLAPAPTNPPLWRYITGPLAGVQYESPYWPGGVAQVFTRDIPITGARPGANAWWAPTALALPDGQIRPALQMVTFSNALTPPTTAMTLQPIGTPVLAADADGDGIADSAMFKLPMGPVNGVTYYAAVRIVDNTAAVNANTAWTYNPLGAVAPTYIGSAPELPGDFFPSSIDLLGMLTPPDLASGAFNVLQSYRWDGDQPTGTYPQAAPAAAWDDMAQPTAPQQRTDITGGTGGASGAFASALEAQWMQLGRRLKNPGLAASGTPFQPLPTNESLNLARGFILRNPDINNYRNSPSLLEQFFPNSVFNAPDAAYFPGNTLPWFQSNFWFAGNPLTPLRSVLTTDNPVSNFAPSKFRDLGTFPAGGTWPPTPPGGFTFGDTITYTYANEAHRYVCINPWLAVTLPPGPTAAVITPTPPSQSWKMDNDAWVYEPWTTAPTKTDVNTATFGQLYAAYASVMASQVIPFPLITSPTRELAPAFPNPWSAGDNYPPYSPLSTAPYLIPSARMFRSPLRVPPPTTPAVPANLHFGLTPVQVMQLRAAIAAVNTIDMRDSDDDITSRTVHLIDNSVSMNLAPYIPGQTSTYLQDVVATVFGIERQPFIIRVYATNAVPAGAPTGTPGYIAIELYNPDTQIMVLDGWGLATIARRNTPVPTSATLPYPQPLAISQIPWGGPSWVGTNAPWIPAGGSIVIASYPTPPAGITLPPGIASALPYPGPVPGGQTMQYIEPNLAQALGNELVLVRPRHSGSLSTTVAIPPPLLPAGLVTPPVVQTAQAGAQTANVPAYYEGLITGGTTSTLYPAEMVPIDSYDFTGLDPLAAGSSGPYTEWYYVRPGAPVPGTQAWHFVYPGHYAFAVNPLNPTGTALPGTSSPPPRLIDGTAHMVGLGAALGLATRGADTTVIPLGAAAAGLPAPVPVDPASPLAVPYRDIPLQLNSVDFAGPNGLRTSPPLNAFPYGGFARNADMLKVPFIGAYRLSIRVPGSSTGQYQLLEFNPVTMDSVMALGLAQKEWAEEPDTVLGPVTTNTLGGTDPIVDTTPTINIESVGRFCPIAAGDFRNPTVGLPPTPATISVPPSAPLPASMASGAVPIDDAAPPLITAPTLPYPSWIYHWASHLFDYLTVQSPQADYLPDVDPAPNDTVSSRSFSAPITPPLPAYPAYRYLPANTPNAPPQPSPVANVSVVTANAEPANSGGATEETAPVEGLININTASWRVLAAVPWVPPDFNNSPPAYRTAAQINIAMSIVFYRDINDSTQPTGAPGLVHGHGPFRSIFDLNNVPIYSFVPGGPAFTGTGTLFQDVLSTPTNTHATDLTTAYNADQGNLSGVYTPNPQIAMGDFESKYMMINRVSNLITTRSDSFTAYILLQGWRNAETDHPTLEVQRRAAFIVDRSGVTPGNPTMAFTKIPAGD